MDNLIQVAHNVIIGENTVIAACVGIAGSTTIGKNCMIGGQAGVGGHLTIGDRVMIQAQSGVLRSIKSDTSVMGYPAIKYIDYNKSYVHFKNLPEMEGNEGRPGLVHRIDKETSGLLVIAKTQLAMNSLSSQFKDHSIKRKYQALIWGMPIDKEGTINVNLRRSLKDRRIIEGFAENTLGKKAITHYKVIETIHYITLIECELETGRTHQIRAHMKHLGHPIFCDKTYGGDLVVKGNRFTNYKKFVENSFKIINRQALHAKSLGFVHPKTKKEVFFDSELPSDIQEIIKKWKK